MVAADEPSSLGLAAGFAGALPLSPAPALLFDGAAAAGSAADGAVAEVVGAAAGVAGPLPSGAVPVGGCAVPEGCGALEGCAAPDAGALDGTARDGCVSGVMLGFAGVFALFESAFCTAAAGLCDPRFNQLSP